MIDVSAGQVVKHERPVYGRMWQTPFADRIRQEAGIATIAVGAISEADHVNTIIDRVIKPSSTLMEAAKYGYAGATWPVQYLAGKSQLDRLIERERSMRAAAEGAPPTGELT